MEFLTPIHHCDRSSYDALTITQIKSDFWLIALAKNADQYQRPLFQPILIKLRNKFYGVSQPTIYTFYDAKFNPYQQYINLT